MGVNYWYAPPILDNLRNGEDDVLEDIEVYDNVVHDCMAGIVQSSEGGTPVRNISIHNNIVYNMGNAGIHIAAYFGANGQRSNIEVYNNTVFNCGTDKEFWWCTGGIFLETHNISNVIIRNNICFNNGFFQIGTTGQDFKALNIIIENNLCHGDMENATLEQIHKHDKNPQHPVYSTPGDTSINANPLFTDASKADFHLKAGSPAIDAGSSESSYNDPDGTRNDLGAYYFGQKENYLDGIGKK